MPKRKNSKRVFDVHPDTIDFRDQMYQATLVDVPSMIDLAEYIKCGVPVLDQGQQGACTGFGLATVANYLLRQRKTKPDTGDVSARMFYEMARRYDEWTGEDYEGSSARGAMKGWFNQGVCSEEMWPANTSDQNFTDPRVQDARNRPLGAYYRVNHKDLVCMHTALAEVGILYATATVHDGWENVKSDGNIPDGKKVLGGHAFAIVAYDREGFWIQNSWGNNWGKNGYAHLSYDDWLTYGTDIWVARLGVPVHVSFVSSNVTAAKATFTQADIRPHIVSLGNDGLLRQKGTYGNSAGEIDSLFKDALPRITEGWGQKKILLYAHGGLTDENSAVQRVANYLPILLANEVYPLSLIWKTDFFTTLLNILQDALSTRRTEGFLDAAKDFILDRIDDTLEPIARNLGGKAEWDEMKENALLATENAQGGINTVLPYLSEIFSGKGEIHIAGHSAGSILLAPLVQLLTSEGTIRTGPMQGRKGYGVKIKTCTLWAPACTMDLFKQYYMDAVENGKIENFSLFTLTGDAEKDDCCDINGHAIYNKSLLYLVSNAFENTPRHNGYDGTPLLGMEKFISADADLRRLLDAGKMDWILSPNQDPETRNYSAAKRHGDFDDDPPTLKATFARILAQKTMKQDITLQRSEASLRRQRKRLEQPLLSSPRRI